MKKNFVVILLITLLTGISQITYAQNTGIIAGTIVDKTTQAPISGVMITVENSQYYSVSDSNGYYKIDSVIVGSYNISASSEKYKPQVKYNLVINSGNINLINFELEESDVLALNTVKLKIEKRMKTATVENPNSNQTMTSEEIKSNPGGNFDISRVVQSLPGVGSTAGSVGGFRNDLIIRGGGPSENVYYLDDIEVPVINHFSTQGAAGGPAGIINVSFLEDVTLYSSAFNSKYDNALSSVLQFKQRDYNKERIQSNIRLSATELATTFDGPISKKTGFMFSARRSYLQLLFKAIDLPILPSYWDFQTKVTSKLNNKTTISFIGLGAIDDFRFTTPKESSPDKEYILRSNPIIKQWNYTNGVTIRRLIKKGYYNFSLSRNMFDNSLDQFADNKDGDESARTLKSTSQEIENKFRFQYFKKRGIYKYSWGITGQYVKYNNQFYNKIIEANPLLGTPEVAINFNTDINFFKYGVFGQVSRGFLNRKLYTSLGLRTDMNTFTNEGNNPLKTLSPRLAISYYLSNKVTLNTSIGRYYKIPTYATLGYQDSLGNFVNKSNTYIESNHIVAGIEYIPLKATRITVEGFYKQYNNYPVSIKKGISLANEGGDFGIVGNEALASVGKGRTYGTEIFVQQKLTKSYFAIAAITLYKSEYTGFNIDSFVPSAWDNKVLVSLLLGKKFNKGWEIGLKYRFAGGSPFTPFDTIASRQNYLITGRGVINYNQLNSQRLGNFQQLDFRIDKKYNFNKWTLDLYLDVTNILMFKSPAYPNYTFKRTDDNSAFATTDGQPIANDGSNGIPLELINNDPLFVPTIGFILEF